MVPREDGWYFLCPRCGKFSRDGWCTVESVTIEYEWRMDSNPEYFNINTDEVKRDESDLLLTRHVCGYETMAWRPDDFIVGVKGGKIIKVCDYWHVYFNKLIELVGTENIDPELLAKYLDKNLK